VSQALDIFLARAVREEGRVRFAYNDATGKRVTCQPGGNLSIGEGINLEVGLDAAEMDFLVQHRASLVEQQLQAFPWYTAMASPAKQSVIIDIGFNAGIGGLLRFPHMIAAIVERDYEAAAQQLHVEDARLDASRYAPLRAILGDPDPPAAEYPVSGSA
jgi:hypothetical protein